MNITKNEKTGKVTGVNEIVASNGNALWQLVVNTANSVNVNELSELTDITLFALAQNERTEFSILIPQIEGVTTEKFANAVGGKDIQIVVFKATIKELTTNKVERISYTTQSGAVRITSTMSRTYINGSQNAVENIAFQAMQDELLTKLNDGTFEVYEEQQQRQQQQQPSKKFTF